MSTLLNPVTDIENERFKNLVDAQVKLLKPEISRIKSIYKKEQVDKLVKSGLTRKRAKKIVKSRLKYKLLPDDILEFDSGGDVAVLAVLDNPEKYNGKTLSDPLEPEQGLGKAKFFANSKTGQPAIHSFIHGGRKYTFNTDKYKVFKKQHASGMVKGKHRVARKENNQITFSTNADLVKHNAGTNIVNDDGKPINIAKYWCDDPKRTLYEGVKFSPVSGMMQSKILTINKDGVLNLYTGMAIEPIDGTCNLIFWHILHIWCNGNQELYEYTLNWLARMLQHPEDRAHTALVLRSDQGAGKGIITDIFDRAFGNHGVTFTDGNKITGKFNVQLATSVFVSANEATYGGDKKEAGIIKGVITDETLNVEPKGIDSFEVSNCIHLVVSTNNDWSIGQDIGDRRLVSYDVSGEKIDDIAYFDALRNEINNGGEEAFLYDLLHRDITSFRPQDRPSYVSQTERENKLRSAPPVIQWFSHIVTCGVIDGEQWTLASVDNARGHTENWNYSIQLSKHEVYNSYSKWCKSNYHRPEGNVSFGLTINKLDVSTNDKRNSSSPRGRYEFPSCDDCEAALENYLVGVV